MKNANQPQIAEYPLVDGFIHNWLSAGPVTLPEREDQAGSFPASGPDAASGAVDRGIFAPEIETAEPLVWKYWRCRDDHLVDLSQFTPDPRQFVAWGYTRVQAARECRCEIILSATGPAEAWLNGQRILAVDASGPRMQSAAAWVTLATENVLVIRAAGAGVQAVPLAFAVRLETPGQPDGVQVQVPLQARYPRRQQALEQAFEHAYLEQVTDYRGKDFNLRFTHSSTDVLTFSYQVQDEQGMIYVEGTSGTDPETVLDVGHTFRLNERPYQVVLRATGKEYFEQHLRYQVELPIHVLDNAYATAPYGSYATRRTEALEDAARREDSLFGQIACMALGRWQSLAPQAVLQAAGRAGQTGPGDAMELVGLLGMLYRFAGEPDFQNTGLQPVVEENLLRHNYHPGERTGARSESVHLLLLTAEILATQRYPAVVGANTRPAGAAVEEAGRLLRKICERGFAEWDSDVAGEQLVVALTHLASLAADEALREISAVALDKLLFLMAVNNYKGVQSGARSQTGHWAARSGKLMATAGISRLLWGMGIFTRQNAGVISLALADYEFPTFFSDIANQPEPGLWNRVRHAAQDGEVDKTAYKTTDYLLSAALDYRPGQPGGAEIAWQAVLAPEAVVFTSHPASIRSDPARQPGFWLGNDSLPRVAQWKDALVAVYRLPEDAWLDFTHAYFPTFSFDEYMLDGPWAFARVGSGYLAICAARGFEMIDRIPDGCRELRSYGRSNTWICQMGREQQDGSFSRFIEHVLALPVEWKADGVTFQSLRGEEISFGWQGALMVAGQEAPLHGNKHIDNPYCSVDFPAHRLDISFGEVLMRLNFD